MRTMRHYRKNAFTLIELLMVIAIIGILAGILIPIVGKVKERGNIVASKAQLSGYVNAIGLFKGEYNYYPFPLAHEDGGALISDITEAEFIGELSATNPDGTRITSAGDFGNRKLIDFYTFSQSDFLEGDSTTEQISDRFNNTNIFIAIDGDGDGLIKGLPDPDSVGATVDIRTKVTAYVNRDDDGNPDYYLYE